ncbi:MAG: hypothetical protein ACRD6X_12795 [Pyrinomonadaceae bacterium]
MSAFHCTSPHVSKGGTIKIGQRILSRQTLSSDDARTALVYTRAFAKKCTSPHVSKGGTIKIGHGFLAAKRFPPTMRVTALAHTRAFATRACPCIIQVGEQSYQTIFFCIVNK